MFITHNPGIQTNASAPHKLFQYWMMSKPVIVSSCKSLKRIVEATRGGLVFQALNHQDLSDCLVRIQKDQELCRELGKNGRDAVINGEYGWNHTQKNLNTIYDNLN